MKKIFIIFIININLFALSTTSMDKIKIAWNYGKKTKAMDGMTFEYAISGIMGQESSWGKHVIGDKYTKTGKLKSLYESSLGNFQIKLPTAKLVIKKTPYLKKKYGYLIYEGKSIYKKYTKLKEKLIKLESTSFKNKIYENKDYDKMVYYNKIFNSKSWNNRAKNNDLKAIQTLAWAKKKRDEYQKKYNNFLIKKDIENKEKEEKIQNEILNIKKELKILSDKAHKDTLLIDKLLVDFNFGAEIAVNYLKMMYNEALSRKMSNPYKKAIGRYNGGWNNMNYYNKVRNRILTIIKLEKEKKLKFG